MLTITVLVILNTTLVGAIAIITAGPKLPIRKDNMKNNLQNRAVVSESLKVGKSLKIGKNRKTIRKIGIDFLFDFLAKMPKCQNACTSGEGPASEFFLKHSGTLEPEVLHR